MSSLKDVLPESSPTVQAIYSFWKTRGESEPRRKYLGGSEIGKECERELWYSFRHCAEESHEGRMFRLFNRGHRAEEVFVEELRGIGCEVHEVDPSTGEQFEIVLFNGHFKGHTDGVALGVPEAPKTWHLVEMKTSNTKQFKKLEKEGVQKAKPIHFAQMQIYMSELNLTRALYLVECKETDHLYAERIKLDRKFVDSLKAKAKKIIFSSTAPTRISERPDAWACKFCAARELCHGIGEVAVPISSLSCRQCCHSTPEEDGSWSCALGEKFGTVCERHLLLPDFVSFASPTDSFTNQDGSQVMEMTSEDGSIWHHGPNEDAGQYSSSVLMSTPRDLIVERQEDVQENGVTHPNLERKWNTELDGIESVWKGAAGDLESEWSRFVEFPMGIPSFTQSTDKYDAADFGSACAIIYSGGRLAEIRVDNNQPSAFKKNEK